MNISAPFIQRPIATALLMVGLLVGGLIAYPLLPNEGFWPEGKKAAKPCRFLCDKGCSIHDEPRPSVCTNFTCEYINGIVPQRPDQNGVIFATSYVSNALQGSLLDCQVQQLVPAHWEDDDLAISITEALPEAIFRLDPQKVRWWYRKHPWRLFVVIPYGFDMFEYDCKSIRIRTPDLSVWFADTPTYADRVISWWNGAISPLAEPRRIPLLMSA